MENGTLKTVLEVSLGSRVGQRRAVPVELGQGSRSAFLAIYCADAHVEPWSEMFFYPTDTPKVALIDAEGKIHWRLDLGKGVVPGIWFCPFFAFDLDGDGLHELVRTTDDGSVEVIDRRGKRLADLGARGHVAMACKLLDLPGEQALVAYPDGTLRIWADPKAKGGEAALARYAHPLYQANRRLSASGSNVSALGGL